MIPKTISFTDFEIDPRTLFRQCSGPIPLDWTRHEFEIINHSGENVEWSVNNWLFAHIKGSWICNYSNDFVKCFVVIGFQDDVDAVMFRLLDGEAKSILKIEN